MAEQTDLKPQHDVISKYEQYGKTDPFPEIQPSLLNSADIFDYVEKTGMLYPFDSSCLKPASYGVKLQGEYIYWESLDKPSIEGRLEETFVKVAPASVETSSLLVVLLQAIQIFDGFVGSTAISLIADGADLVAQVAPSLVVTYNVVPVDA